MRTRPIAIIVSAATLSMAAAPLAAAASNHRSPDPKRDKSHHVDRSRDSKSAEARTR